MIHSRAVRNVFALKERECLFPLGEPHEYRAVAAVEADKAALAIAREADRVRTIRLLVGGVNED